MEEEVVLPIGTKIIIKKTPWRTSKPVTTINKQSLPNV